MKKVLALFSALLPLIVFGEAKEGILSLGLGDFNVTGHHHKLLFQAEYKWPPIFYDLRTQGGIFITEQQATYIYSGIAYDIYMGESFVLTPSFAPGLYMRGKGKSLGFPLEFRSCIELAFRFCNGARLGSSFYHLSNASLGYKNPGVNNFALFYGIPIRY